MATKRTHLLVGLLALAISGCSKSAQTHYEAGNRYAAEGKTAEAVLEYRNAVAKEPTLGDAQLKLAETLLKGGDLGRTLPEFVKAADLLPDRADVQVRAGALLLLARRFEEARARADKALAREPAHVEALVLRANALAGLSNLDEAIEQIESAIGLDPRAGLYTNLGALQQARGHRDEAEAAFRKAITLDPASVAVQLALANFLWATGRVPEAEQGLKAAYGLDPKHLLANRALATFYLASNRVAEAEPHLVAVANATNAPGPKLGLATYYVGVGRAADAARVLDEVAKTPARWAVARARTASLRLAEGKATEALAIVDEVLAKEPRHVEGLVTRTRVLLALSRTEEAHVAVQAAIAADPRSIEGHYLRGTILSARGEIDGATTAFNEVLRLNPRAAAAQVQLARLALVRGTPAASVQLADAAIASEPGNVMARLVLARGLLAQRQFGRAQTELDRLLKAYPNAGPVHVQIGVLRLQQGQRAAARTAFERALALDAGSHEAFGALVGLDLADKRFDAAEARLAPRLARTPPDSRVLVLAARTALARGNKEDAESRLRQAIESDPGNLDAYGLLGQFYLAQGKLDEARREFDAVTVRQPRAIGAHTLVGMILQAQGKNAEARARYERIVQIEPRAAVAANNLAWLYAEAGDHLPTALKLAQAAQLALPERPEVLDTLGFVYLKQGQPTLAIAPLREAVQGAPGNPVYRARLGAAYARAGQSDAARRELEQALKTSATFPGAEEARKTLEGLGDPAREKASQ